MGAGRRDRREQEGQGKERGKGIEGQRKRRRSVGRLRYCGKIRESERGRYGTIISTSYVFPEP